MVPVPDTSAEPYSIFSDQVLCAQPLPMLSRPYPLSSTLLQLKEAEKVGSSTGGEATGSYEEGS